MHDLNETLEEIYASFNDSIYNDNVADMLGFDLSFRKNIRIKGRVPTNKVEFMETVRSSMYASIACKKKSGVFGDRYSIALVAPSVIPTFNPAIRVLEYNITDSHDVQSASIPSWDEFFFKPNRILEDDTLDELTYDEDELDVRVQQYQVLSKHPDKSAPPIMPKSKHLGPAYIPQLFTPQRYVQYYLDFKAVNKGDKPFEFEIEYTTEKDYGLKDLIVQVWLKFGRKIG